MCGIAGFLSKKQSRTKIISIVDKMIESTRWRGPDDKGIYTNSYKDTILGMAHRRLSIVDLSVNGHQPMIMSDGKFAICYNGEVYNYIEIRQQLIAKGHSFCSETDTEVVLHACVEYGVEKATSLFNGMWAFAFWDEENGILTLSRDRLGVKPLYYSYDDNGFSFASDIRSFIYCGLFNRKIDFDALHGYLWNMYIPAPKTIFHDVYKLEPGTNLAYEVGDGSISLSSYWSARNIRTTLCDSYEEYVDRVESLLTDSVKLRLEADVPVGIFLSGGIDSSIVTALAQKEKPGRINTFSIGFKEKKDDDATVAKMVSDVLGTNHTELFCTQKDALKLIEKIPEAYAEPFADNSQIPTLLLCDMTKKHVTVALSGDGGDEMFVGYPSYLRNRDIYLKRKKLNFPARFLEPFSKFFPDYSHFRWIAEKFRNASTITNTIFLDYITANDLINTLFDKDCPQFGGIGLFGGYDYERNGLDIIRGGIMQSIEFGLPDDMLTKVDRASMYYSLECRSPILDYRLVEAALAAPLDFNVHEGKQKAPLRDILYKYVSKEIVERPKSGFGVPINEWIHSELNDVVNDFLSPNFINKQGIFNTIGIQKFTKEFNTRKNPILDRLAYTLLVFQLWWNNYYIE